MTRGANPDAVPDGHLLTLDQAAELLDCSLSYVAMLAANGILPGSNLTADEQWQIPITEIQKWMAQQWQDADYRRAAMVGAMYDIPDSAFVKGDVHAAG